MQGTRLQRFQASVGALTDALALQVGAERRASLAEAGGAWEALLPIIAHLHVLRMHQGMSHFSDMTHTYTPPTEETASMLLPKQCVMSSC